MSMSKPSKKPLRITRSIRRPIPHDRLLRLRLTQISMRSPSPSSRPRRARPWPRRVLSPLIPIPIAIGNRTQSIAQIGTLARITRWLIQAPAQLGHFTAESIDDLGLADVGAVFGCCEVCAFCFEAADYAGVTRDRAVALFYLGEWVRLGVSLAWFGLTCVWAWVVDWSLCDRIGMMLNSRERRGREGEGRKYLHFALTAFET